MVGVISISRDTVRYRVLAAIAVEWAARANSFSTA
jgi:hypothetical protein